MALGIQEATHTSNSLTVQSLAAQFVSGVEGCPYNVMGFPLHRFCAVLRALLAPEHDVSGDAHR